MKMNCAICLHSIDLDEKDTYFKLSEKEIAGINNANKQRSLESKNLVFNEGNPFFVHKRCQSKHTNPKNLKATQKRKTSIAERSVLNLRSADPEFSFKTHCFICG